MPWIYFINLSINHFAINENIPIAPFILKFYLINDRSGHLFSLLGGFVFIFPAHHTLLYTG